MTTTVLDLLSVVGKLALSGDAGFGEAARLASGSAADDFTSRRLRRDLEGLGHVRCVYGNVREVHVLAPRLCLLPGGISMDCQAILSGARTQRSTSELDCLCTQHGVVLEKRNLGNGLPERVLLRGTYPGLDRVAYGLQIDIGDDPAMPDAWRLLHHVTPLQDILRPVLEKPTGYDTIPAPFPRQHAYDPRTGAFALWERLAEGYSSRLLLLRKTPYDYRLARKTSTGAWRLHLDPLAFDPRWAMWAVRLAHEGAPPDFAPSSARSLRVPAACSLPAGLHQVACLCTGLPPQKTNEWLEYPDVPHILQHGIHQRLTLGNVL